MFGSSNPFGQSSNSPFGSPSVFGQNNNPNNNPFSAKPFGSTSPFGSQTGSSIFGGTSTGVFGTPASSPVFGASSSPAFGSSVPAFGASSSPAFGASSSFGGSSVFGQKPAFGGFGSTAPSSPFVSSFQQSQPAFGSNLFGSSSFGASSQPAFGTPSTLAFGASSTPAFGATSTPAFGAPSTPAFGSTSTPTFVNTGSAFGTSVFGSSTSAFGASSTPAFGASSTPAFGASSTPAFGASSTPAFGASSTPAFGASSTPLFGSSPAPAFGATSSPFSFASRPAFGESTSAFGSSPFGGQTTTPAFGSPGFGQPSFGGQQCGGTRVTPYAQTPEADSGSGTQPAGKLESISAMPAYKEKSHEELRWEDYQLGDKGGPNPAAQSSGGMGFNMNTTQPTNPFASSSPAFGQSSANPFSSPTSTNPLAPKTSTFGTPGFGSSTPSVGSLPFGAASSNPFGSTPSTAPSAFWSTPAFGSTTSTSLFGTPSSSAFGTSTSIFGTQAQGTTSAFGGGLNFGSTQSSPLFQSTTPSLGQTSSPFGQAPSAFGQAAPSFGQSTPTFGQSNAFGGNMFSSISSLLSTSSMGFNQTTPSLSMPFQSVQPTQNTVGFGFGAPAGGTSSIFGQSNFGQPSAVPALAQPQSITNPFGTLPAMPQMSIGRVGNIPSIQYGISSLPVSMVDMLDDLPAIEPRKLDRRTIIIMKLAADMSGMGLRFIGSDGRPFQPAQVIIVPEQQQQPQVNGAMPDPEPIREEPVRSPAREEEPPQHPPHIYRAVRLTEPLEALLHQIAARCDETALQMAEADRRRAAWEARVERRLDRYEDLVQWTVASEHARRDWSQLPPFPEPRVYADDGSSAGPS